MTSTESTNQTNAVPAADEKDTIFDTYKDLVNESFHSFEAIRRNVLIFR